MLSNNLFNALFQSHPEIVDNFSLGNDIVIASDFREKKNQEEFWGICFLLSDLNSIQPFFHYCKELKERFNVIGQEIKYSKQKAHHILNSFLNAADTIEGILFNFAIDSSFSTVFKDSNTIHQKSDNLSKFKFYDFQKLELFSHLVGLIISEIKSEITSIKWISDNDNLINNPSRRDSTLNFFYETIIHYRKKNDFRKEFIDPNLDNEDRILTDLSNIADLIVSPIVDILNQYKKENIKITSDVVKFPALTKTKAIKNSEWFFSNHKPLKKVNIIISYDKESDMILFDGLTP